jgi:hypothetical protein
MVVVVLSWWWWHSDGALQDLRGGLWFEWLVHGSWAPLLEHHFLDCPVHVAQAVIATVNSAFPAGCPSLTLPQTWLLPRFELGLMESKATVLTTTLQNHGTTHSPF